MKVFCQQKKLKKNAILSVFFPQINLQALGYVKRGSDKGPAVYFAYFNTRFGLTTMSWSG